MFLSLTKLAFYFYDITIEGSLFLLEKTSLVEGRRRRAYPHARLAYTRVNIALVRKSVRQVTH